MPPICSPWSTPPRETLPPPLGLPFDLWTSGRLSAYLAQQTGMRIAPGWLRVLPHRQRFAGGRAKHTLDHLQDPEDVTTGEQPPGRRWGEKVAADPERDALHDEDETQQRDYSVPGSRVWHRSGPQPTLPAAGTNRRVTICGRVEAMGRGRIEVLQARQDSAEFWPRSGRRSRPATPRPDGR